MKKLYHRVLYRGIIPLSILVMTGILFITCDTGGGESKSEPDPIAVDLSLPTIDKVPAFTGTFVTDESAAGEMVGGAMTEISSFTSGTTSSQGGSRSLSARSVQSQPIIDEVYDHRTDLLSGAEVTGFIKGTATQSAANDSGFGSTRGDYYEMSVHYKMEIAFANRTHNGMSMSGKFAYDESLRQKFSVTDPGAQKGSFTMSLDTNDGYALSVSKNGHGLKFIMKIQAKGDGTESDTTSAAYTSENLLRMLEDILNTGSYTCTIDIYDNDNVSKWNKSFTSYKDAAAFLGQ